MKTKEQQLEKINKERHCLMILLKQLKQQININPSQELYDRRKKYRIRLTKLTEKKHSLLNKKI